MLASLMVAAALWPSPVVQQCNLSDEVSIVGIAQSASGKFLYCEQISIVSERELDISYSANGKLIAQKKITSSDNPAAPSIMQKDFRFGELRLANVYKQHLDLQYQLNEKAKVERTSVSMSNVDVVDAGFDYFIRQHWDELQTKKILSVNFASIVHQKVLPLRLRTLASEKCSDEAKSKDQQQYCYFVEVDNALLRLALGNIKLIYDGKRRLKNFNGLVNIADEKGESQTANILYYYKADYE